ncbi:MAG: IS5 family transposase [Oxalobacteraceae bacterium]|nr:MAG: IS5 family transposase [Oxalobacteraceae bacterium]
MRRHELSDEEWQLVAPLVRHPMGRPTKFGDRHFLNAVLWKVRTGVPWRDLPSRYGCWKTIYSRFRRWARAGHFTALFKSLQITVDKDFCAIDGSYVRAHQHSAGGRNGSKKTALDLVAAAVPPSCMRALMAKGNRCRSK